MGVLDHFRPDHRHSDPERRRAAIEDLTDDEILVSMARSDPVEEVRLAATRAISGPGPLRELVRGTEDTSVQAAARVRLRSILDRVGCVEELEAIVREVRDPRVRASGLDRIGELASPEAASRLLESLPPGEERGEVVRHLRDEDALRAVVHRSEAPDLLVAAIGRLLRVPRRRPEMAGRLGTLARPGTPDRVRRIAAFGVVDPELLRALTGERDAVLRIAGRLGLYAHEDDRLRIAVRDGLQPVVSFPRLVSGGLTRYLEGAGLTVSEREEYFHHHLTGARGDSHVEGWTHRVFLGSAEVASLGVSKDSAESPDFGTGGIELAALEGATEGVAEAVDQLVVALQPLFARLAATRGARGSSREPPGWPPASPVP